MLNLLLLALFLSLSIFLLSTTVINYYQKQSPPSLSRTGNDRDKAKIHKRDKIVTSNSQRNATLFENAAQEALNFVQFFEYNRKQPSNLEVSKESKPQNHDQPKAKTETKYEDKFVNGINLKVSTHPEGNVTGPVHRHHHHKMHCKVSFEAQCDMYYYVRFWNKRFYPRDCYQSPLRSPLGHKAPIEEQKFVVFRPDNGGWNNIRMAAEVAIIFAHATGRTLVLPPAMTFYLLAKNSRFEENLSTFNTFFDFRKISESMTIMTMKDFLEKVAAKGFLKKTFPKNLNIRVLVEKTPRQQLWDYLEKACYVEEWSPGKQFIGLSLANADGSLPISPRPEDIAQGVVPVKKAVRFGAFNHSSIRVKHMVAHGRKLRPYDEAMDKEVAIYFPGDYRETHRILTHYYTYLYWEDEKVAKIYKRLVRDRLHYHDMIFCNAGYIVKRIHHDASLVSYKPMPDEHRHADHKTFGGNTNKDATYFAYHIRRGDFQYSDTRVSAEQIWAETKHLLNPNVTKLIYISTDENNKAFFKPFLESGYQIKFLSDYLPDLHKHTKDKLNMNHIGMIEQVICANAHTFIGTPYSTFTGYITRMRGYYRDGRYERTFYTLKSFMYQIQKQRIIKGPFWAREFEAAHTDADDFY